MCDKVGHIDIYCPMGKPSLNPRPWIPKNIAGNACLAVDNLNYQCGNQAILKCGCSFPVVGNVCDHIPSNLPITQGCVGETPVSILRDTGCSGIVVRQTPSSHPRKNLYFTKGVMFYRRFQREKTNEEWTQLVVPRVFRKHILRLGHKIILAVHLGVRMTSDRICRNFYWPSIFGDITRFCQYCDICQRTVNRGSVKVAPIQSSDICQRTVNRGSVKVTPVQSCDICQRKVNRGSVKVAPIQFSDICQRTVNRGSVKVTPVQSCDICQRTVNRGSVKVAPVQSCDICQRTVNRGSVKVTPVQSCDICQRTVNRGSVKVAPVQSCDICQRTVNRGSVKVAPVQSCDICQRTVNRGSVKVAPVDAYDRCPFL